MRGDELQRAPGVGAKMQEALLVHSTELLNTRMARLLPTPEAAADPLCAPHSMTQVLDQDRSPMLFSLVFGEGVVNDAVSIVLLRAVQGIRCVWARACPCGGILPICGGGLADRAGAGQLAQCALHRITGGGSFWLWSSCPALPVLASPHSLAFAGRARS